MHPSKFGVNWPFCSGEEAKNRFSRWPPWRPSWIYDRLLLIYKSPWCFLPRLESIGLSVQEKKRKNRFSRWRPWRPSWISDRHDFSYFWSTSHPDASFPSKFGVNWPFGSGEEAKNRFSRWQPWWPSRISDQHDFSYFWSKSHPDAS